MAAMKALVVDDDPGINRLVEVRLKGRSYEVHTASDGEQAIAALDSGVFDLMLLDVSMPGVGGLEVLEEVRKRELDMAVVMMTAFGSEQVAVDALRLGADDYLRKPFEPVDFQGVIDRTVDRLQLRRMNVMLQQEVEAQNQLLEAERARAGEVQRALLPRSVAAPQGFEVAARCQPLAEVGGDFYDWHESVPGFFTLTVGDAMDKGMPAALQMATVRAAIRSVAPQFGPTAALELVDRALGEDMARTKHFMTLFHARLSVGARRLSYVDAGHGCGFVLRASGEVEKPASGGLPLGVLPGQTFRSARLVLNPGDLLIIHTDGLLPEAARSENASSELAGKLTQFKSAEEVVERLLALSPRPQVDDVTVVALRCLDE